MIKVIDQRIRRFMGGIRLAFRGVITLCNAAGQIQFVQVNGVNGEQLQDAELFQHFGFTSNVPKGAMCVVLPIGGRTAHGIVIATEHGTYRLANLASGETAIYNQWGDYVALKANRHMQIVSQAAVDIQAPTTTMSGDLQVQGKITAQGDIDTQGNVVAQGDVSDHGNKSMANMRLVFNSHTQPVSGSVAGAPGTLM